MIVNGRVRLAEVDSLLYTPEEGVPRPEHVGIFTKCIGELDNVSYLGANFDIRAIEDYLLELYGSFRNSAAHGIVKYCNWYKI